tara:strand:- start:1241 stop:1918 length:678 start_codon:yes stop_codon:yes gene_type:complete
MFSEADLLALILSLKLASTVTVLLLIIGTPLAWMLAQGRGWVRRTSAAIIALPMVLPPTVIGFYLLVAAGPEGPIGHLTQSLGLGTLPFTFWGLVIASMLYSMPFVILPLLNAFESLGRAPLEMAASLRAGPVDRFFSVALPMTRPAFLTAALLGFVHAIGEFGVVLMIGGSIPGQTRVVSVQIYDHVEAFDYASAHWLAGSLLVFSFLVLVLLYSLNPKARPFR